MHFRLQVAATAFHQGLMALAFQYGPDVDVFDRGAQFFSVTNLPHVRLDLTETTMVELTIPFLFLNDFYPILTTGTTDVFGRVSVTTILPIISVVGMNAPTYELYTFLSDVQLIGADSASSTTVALQSGGVATAESKQSHLFSRGLATAARITRFVGSGIPSLSGIAGPASWVLDGASGIAKYFGYSRPMIQDPSTMMYRADGMCEANVDMPAVGYVVGSFKGNALSITPAFAATDVDEMSFDFIKSQYSQICVGVVSTANSHGDAIYAAPVTLCVMWYRSPISRPFCNIAYPRDSASIAATGNSFFPSHVMNLASFFRFWRGGFVYRFTFAKTKFHGGRYMITYNPKTTINTSASTFANVEGPEVSASLVQPYGYSKIMDLKDGNVFEFYVPYSAEVPYVSFDSAIGSLTVVCIDPLTASASVTGSVPFLVEVKAADDFEFADYAGPMFVTQSAGTVYTQSGGDVVVKSVTKDTAPETIGEKMMSVKQIIQTPFWYGYSQGANSVGNVVVFPWYVNYSNRLIGTGALPNPTSIALSGTASPSNILAKAYVFAKGGTDIHMYPTSQNVSFSAFQAATLGRAEYVSNLKNYLLRPLVANLPRALTGLGQALHARFPAYQFTRRLLTSSLDGVASIWSSSYVFGLESCHYNFVTVRNVGSVSSDYLVARSAADDAALGCYMGPVPLYVPNAAVVAPLDVSAL
jgi:hypothetical protein